MSEGQVLLYFDGFWFGYVAQDTRLREKKKSVLFRVKNPASAQVTYQVDPLG
jgi:hypothetical protein